MSQHVEFFHFFIFNKFRVPTQPGKPGKMRVHLENLEIWNFEKFNNIMEKWHETWKNWVATKNSPLTPLKLYKIY